MQQTSSELSSAKEETTLDQQDQAKQWLKENHEAIEAYKAKQAKQGTTFSQWVGQI